jgi:NAD(P)-dependent dehydrogenase (short-subunit alcohol dehydrogenase family)
VGEDGDGHADQAAGGYTDADIIDRVADESVRHPEDVAAAVAYLADSTPSGYVNGHALSVDGGWYADGSWDSLRLRHR